jgi:DNA excision repair protein ERCC-3
MPRTAPTAAVPKVPFTCDPANPCIVQSDRTILVEVDNPRYGAARDALAPFAELEKSPEHLHTYRISNLSLWNAAAVGLSAQQVIETLLRFTKFPLPANLPIDIAETMARYGRIKLERFPDAETGLALRLVCDQPALLVELRRHKGIRDYLGEELDERSCRVAAAHRGVIKQALIALGYPVEDLAGYTEGADLRLALRERTLQGRPFVVRDYQREAAAVFYAGGQARGGSGVIVLPCGAGKTIVGLTVMALLQKSTLILTTSITAVKQWKRELLDKTTLTPEQIKEYTGESKEIGPVTIATYQILTYRPDKTEEFPHFGLFEQRDWGLIIYDEVHLLPAPVFRVTAQIQARRRLGLTATLIREDGREGDVFALIGPKRYDVPWRELESQGWIAPAQCTEIRVCLPDDAARLEYAVAERRAQYRLASENPAKEEVVAALLRLHAQQQVLIIGQYLSQLRRLSRRFQLPLITGSTPTAEREQLYAQFRQGQLRHLILSKVGNFAIDLPDAHVLIQVSGTFGSRQEEAQRLGRILRPKSDGSTAHFYTLVTRDTCEQDFAHHRQLFLTEQGYAYEILDASELVPSCHREAG